MLDWNGGLAESLVPLEYVASTSNYIEPYQKVLLSLEPFAGRVEAQSQGGIVWMRWACRFTCDGLELLG